MSIVYHLHALGESGMPLLLMGSGHARSLALANTSCLAEDICSAEMNPAGLNTISRPELALSYFNLPLDFYYFGLHSGFPLSVNKKWGSAGISFAILSSDDFTEFNETGTAAGTLSASEWSLAGSYAFPALWFISPDINLDTGITLKYYNSVLKDISKHSICFDLGFLYRMDFYSMSEHRLKNNLSLGLAFQNLGPAVNYLETRTDLPSILRIGTAYHFFQYNRHTLLLAMEIRKPAGFNTIAGTAMEYSFNQMVYLRLGYEISPDTESSLLFGAGLHYNLFKTMKADYTFQPVANQGFMHSMTFGISF